MKRRYFSLLLATAILLTLLPMAASAVGAAPAQPLVRSTGLNLTESLVAYQGPDGAQKTANPQTAAITDSAEGWSWDVATKVLTLHGANIRGEDNADDVATQQGIWLPDGATLVLADNTTSYVRGGSGLLRVSTGISTDGSLTIEGSGMLFATGGNATHSCGIYMDGSASVDSTLSIRGNVVVSTTGGSGVTDSCGILTRATGNGGVSIEDSALLVACRERGSGAALGTEKPFVDTPLTGSADGVFAVYGPADGFHVIDHTGNELVGLELTTSVPIGNLNDDGYQWDGETLTLKNLIISVDGNGLSENSYGLKAPDNAVIKLEGLNILRGGESFVSSVGLYSDGALTLEGSGTAIAVGDTVSAGYLGSLGVYVDQLTMNGDATLAAIGGKSYTSGGILGTALYINDNATLSAIGGSSSANISHSYGVGADALYINGRAKVTAIGGNADGNGQSNGVGISDMLHIGNGTTATFIGGYSGQLSFGGTVVTTVIDGGTLTSLGGTTDIDSYGLFSTGLTESDSPNLLINSGTVTAIGGAAGWYSDGMYVETFTMNGGSLTATGGIANRYSYGITATDSPIVVNGGSIVATGSPAGRESYGIVSSFDFSILSGMGVANGDTAAFKDLATLKPGSNIVLSPSDGVGTTVSWGIPATAVLLSEPALSLTVGGSTALTATVTPAISTDRVIWSSDLPSIAAVDGAGNVTAVGPGTAIVTATAGTVSASCTVTVDSPASSSIPSRKPTVTVTNTGGTAVGKADGSVTITPDQGYEIDSVTVNGAAIAIPENNKLTGLRAGDKVVVCFKKTVSIDQFSDLESDAWYSSYAKFAVDRGLFEGTSGSTFTPYGNMTRGMFFTTLARFDGQRLISGEQWYSSALDWASDLKISDGRFPEEDVTREQLAVMLFRYAEIRGHTSDTTLGNLAAFSDADTASPLAADALCWCVSKGILTGRGGTHLSPQSPATRIEVAAMFQRFDDALK